MNAGPVGRTLVAALAMVLTGCAALRRDDAADKPPEPVAAPAYRLEIDAPKALAALLREHLDLARFQNTPAAERITDFELDRLAAATPAQARALLETQGHFEADVKVNRVAPDAADADALPRLRVRVDPGPVVRVTSVAIDATGDLKTAIDAGDERANATLAKLRADWPLGRGQVFTQDGWSDAKNRTMAQLRAAGYASASWGQTEARVDVATQGVGLRAVAASGPLFRLGELRAEGLRRYDAKSISRLALYSPGDPATERTLLDFQERLQKLGLFESVSVELDPDPASAPATPVTVRLREQPLQQATVGVGVSTNTGPRVTLEHLHRRPFGIPWVAKNTFEVGGRRRAWDANLVSHPVPRRYRNLISAGIERLETDGEVRRTVDARVGRTQDSERLERLYFGEYTQERLTNAAGTVRREALSAHYQWVFRDLDNALLPTDGQSLSAGVAGGYAKSDLLDDGPFGRVLARLTTWRPIGETWYGTARVEFGQVLARRETGVPDSLLFRAGGDESVRGYAYRSLGPVRDGVTVSGRALATASVELARPVWRGLPSLWGAVFVDAGNAADSFGDLKPVVGYGVGARLRSPVGPLRVDLAYGHEVRKLRLHLSIGIAF